MAALLTTGILQQGQIRGLTLLSLYKSEHYLKQKPIPHPEVDQAGAPLPEHCDHMSPLLHVELQLLDDGLEHPLGILHVPLVQHRQLLCVAPQGLPGPLHSPDQLITSQLVIVSCPKIELNKFN